MKILFVCHGNICRSPMAEFVMKDLLRKAGRNDLIIGMDSCNIADLRRLVYPEDRGKIKRMLEFANVNRDVADPWYTGNFDATWDDILAGCTALVKELKVGF